MTLVERLDAAAWARLRRIRLRALDDEPDAFGASLETERGRDDDAWRQATARGAWWIAAEGDEDVGLIAGGRREGDEATRWVYSMWVATAARGHGVADALVDEVVRWAIDEGAVRLGLDVTDRVPRARRFYERYGFTATGVAVPLPREPTIALHELTLELRGRAPSDGAGS